jgi:hypothetical protein
MEISRRLRTSLRMIVLALSSAVLVGYLAGPASAASYQITFAASDFSPTPSVPLVLGQLGLSFDSSHDSVGSVTVGFFDGLDLSSMGPVTYRYAAQFDTLLVAAGVNGFDVPRGGTDNFAFQIQNFTTTPTLELFGYSTSSSAHIFTSENVDVHVAVSATPIPQSLPLLVTALSGLGWFGWRNRRMAA